MGRINVRRRRTQATRDMLPGKVYIFIEGDSEWHYLEHIRTTPSLKQDGACIKIHPTPSGGSAQALLDQAEAFLNGTNNAKKYAFHDKYLVFDCDKPENIVKVLSAMHDSEYGYLLAYSNPSFEVWLLMHFQSVPGNAAQEALESALASHFGKRKYIKGKMATLAIEKGDIHRAISLGKECAKKHADKRMPRDIRQANPYTTVHELIALLIRT